MSKVYIWDTLTNGDKKFVYDKLHTEHQSVIENIKTISTNFDNLRKYIGNPGFLERHVVNMSIEKIDLALKEIMVKIE